MKLNKLYFKKPSLSQYKPQNHEIQNITADLLCPQVHFSDDKLV